MYNSRKKPGDCDITSQNSSSTCESLSSTFKDRLSCIRLSRVYHSPGKNETHTERGGKFLPPYTPPPSSSLPTPLWAPGSSSSSSSSSRIHQGQHGTSAAHNTRTSRIKRAVPASGDVTGRGGSEKQQNQTWNLELTQAQRNGVGKASWREGVEGWWVWRVESVRPWGLGSVWGGGKMQPRPRVELTRLQESWLWRWERGGAAHAKIHTGTDWKRKRDGILMYCSKQTDLEESKLYPRVTFSAPWVDL